MKLWWECWGCWANGRRMDLPVTASVFNIFIWFNAPGSPTDPTSPASSWLFSEQKRSPPQTRTQPSEIHYDFKISCHFFSRSDQGCSYLFSQIIICRWWKWWSKGKRVGKGKKGGKADSGWSFIYLFICKVWTSFELVWILWASWGWAITVSKPDPSRQKILTFSKKDLNACFQRKMPWKVNRGYLSLQNFNTFFSLCKVRFLQTVEVSDSFCGPD